MKESKNHRRLNKGKNEFEEYNNSNFKSSI